MAPIPSVTNVIFWWFVLDLSSSMNYYVYSVTIKY